MRITNVKAMKLNYPINTAIMDSFCYIKQRSAVWVQVETDAGISGFAEAGSYGGSVDATYTIIEKELKHILVGENPLFKERLWWKVYKKCYQHGRGGIVQQALAGIDTALWDICGKVAGLPVYQLLGGYKNKIRAYASCGFYKEGEGLQALVTEMKDKVDKGYTAVKMKIGRISTIRNSKLPILDNGEVGSVSIQEDLQRVRTVRETIGDDVDLLVDANSSWDFKTAVYMAKQLEKYHVYLIEEPVITEDMESSAELARLTTIPIAGYETAFTKEEFKRIFEKRAVDIAQPDVIWSGGLTECMKIAALASTFNIPVIPHCFSSALSYAGNLQFAAAISNCDLIEFDQNINPLRDEIVENPIKVENGYITLSERPGLGVEINQRALDKYRIL